MFAAVCFAAGFDYSTKVLVCVHRRGTTNFVSGPIVVFTRLMFIYILAAASTMVRPPSPRAAAKYVPIYVYISYTLNYVHIIRIISLFATPFYLFHDRLLPSTTPASQLSYVYNPSTSS